MGQRRFGQGRLGQPARIMEQRRGELLALTYLAGDIGVVTGWAANPQAVANRAAMAVLVTFVFLAAIVMWVLRHRLPVWVGDVAIVGSLVLIDLANFFLFLHVYPALLMPYYVWVGFTAPMWFPWRRAATYVLLSALASGLVVIVADTGSALALWLVTMATMAVAFMIVSFLARALVRQERLAAIGEMASAMSHDLRTPLAAVTNSLFLLRRGIGEEEASRLQRHFDMAENQMARAVSISEHLVAYVRPHPPTLAPVDLDQLVATVIESLPAPDGVDVHVTGAPVTVIADGGQLGQVVTNLMANAYEAIPDGGTVRVGVSAHNGAAVVTVEDTGPGLDRAVAERAFEPFYTTKASGTGLGLAIVGRLVEAHGGTVTVDSKPGQATRFTVRVPLVPSKRGVGRGRTPATD
jgi:signal transduction histidine kinase